MSIPRHPTAALTLGVLLSSLLMGGCATDKALTEQTQPLQDRIARLEQTVAASKEEALRAVRAQAARSAAQQSELAEQFATMQAGIRALHDRIKAQEEQAAQTGRRVAELDKSLGGHAERTDKRLDEIAGAADAASRQAAALTAKRQADDAAASALVERIAKAEGRLEETAGAARAAAQQAAALKSRQDADSAALGAAMTGADAALAGRVAQAEQRLKDLSALVQEAMAQAAKEIFLANGREAFTVTLTEDKVLYPQNDPHLDSRDTAKLDQLAERLAGLDQEYHLDIQGHTDNNSTDDNNYNLGKARAEVVKRHLHEKKGISISRMSTISYGANKPLDAANGHNRRIFIRVLVLK